MTAAVPLLISAGLQESSSSGTRYTTLNSGSLSAPSEQIITLSSSSVFIACTSKGRDSLLMDMDI